MSQSHDEERDPACIGYGIAAHHAPRVSENESLCPQCLADLKADVAAWRPLRGGWRTDIPGHPGREFSR